MSKAFMHRSTNSNRFETPYPLTQSIIDAGQIPFWAHIKEPACGNGAIVRVLEKNGYSVSGTDIDPGDGYDQEDFYTSWQRHDFICTNPPYGKEADKFVIKAKQTSKYGFAMLLRTNYLSGSDRGHRNIYDELKSIWVLNRMPDLSYPIREDWKFYTGGIVYAWYIWERGYSGLPVFHRLDVDKYAISPPRKIRGKEEEDA